MGWPKTQEAGSSHLQETFMHRVSVIVRCAAVIQYNHKRNRNSLYICFSKINHLVPNTICIHPLMYGKLCRAQVVLFRTDMIFMKGVTVNTWHCLIQSALISLLYFFFTLKKNESRTGFV